MPLTNAMRDFYQMAAVGETVTPFSSANAHIGVGDGTDTFSATQPDLMGTNKFRKAIDAGFPTRSEHVLTFRSTFGATEANFAWNEWGVFNAATGGVMMNRKVEPLGTKAAGSTWMLTVTLTLNIA